MAVASHGRHAEDGVAARARAQAADEEQEENMTQVTTQHNT